MKIVVGFPPNFEELKQRFAVDKNVLFAYGDTIYNPYEFDLSKRPDLVHHEEVHSRQQAGDPESWWRKYIKDPQFVIDQEAEAYAAQALFFRETKGDEGVAIAVRSFADSLSGPVYGKYINRKSAIRKIKQCLHA